MAQVIPLYSQSAGSTNDSGVGTYTHESLSLTNGVAYVVFTRFEYKASGITGGTDIQARCGNLPTYIDNETEWREYSTCSVGTAGGELSITQVIEFIIGAAGASVTTANRAILAIPLTQLTAGTHYLNVGGSGSPTEPGSDTTWTSLQQVDVGDLIADAEDWLCLATLQKIGDDPIDMRLNKNSGSATSPTFTIFCGDPGASNGGRWAVIGQRFSLSDNDTIDIEVKQTNAGGGASGIADEFFAINLDRFAQSSSTIVNGDRLIQSSGESVAGANYTGDASGTNYFIMLETGGHEAVNSQTQGFVFHNTTDGADYNSGESGSTTGDTDGLIVPAFHFLMTSTTDDNSTIEADLLSDNFAQYDDDPDPSTENLVWPAVYLTFALFETDATGGASIPSPGYNPRHVQMSGGAIVMQGGMIL